MLFLPIGTFSQDDDLLDLSLEELMNLEITSLSKKTEKLQNVPSSIYVITQSDIERSSAQNLMHLLRENVPGFWAVANDYKNVDAFIRNANEGSVLILLDGTPMFDQMFSAFDYENFEIPLSQIDRIEVIRGSGGTIYGANSATGVINIFTKNPEDGDKFYVEADYAIPGKIGASIISSPLKSEKANASVYGKFTSFSGFEQMAEVTNPTSVVPKTFGIGDTTINNRFTGDDNQFISVAGGFKFGYRINEKLNLSAALHYNYANTNKYRQFFPPEKASLTFSGNPDNPKLFTGDSVALMDIGKQRFLGNIRVDYAFNEYHSLFARISTNKENSDYSYGGGFNAKNGIVDFELQDNFELGFNTLSVGGNYRSVKYNLSEFSEMNSILYTNNSRTESLIGIFAQDKISLLDEKLNIYVGIKAENFSLIDDKFYFSPMLKFAFLPSDYLTVWGGYNQSYTTPGYNLTDVEFTLFRAPTPEVFYNYAYPLARLGVYMDTYNQTLDLTQDPTAAATAANDFVESPTGLYVIDSVINEQIAGQIATFPEHYNVSAINGPGTKPTSFKNIELGFRYNTTSFYSFETSFYYSIMKDGIGSNATPLDVTESLVRPGEYIQTYYYGNYLKGTNMGVESMLKLFPADDLILEFSHSWFKYNLEHQENDDFDINELTENDRELVDDKYKQIPEHILRSKIYYTYKNSLQFSITAMYASAFYTKFEIVEPTYSYELQRFDPLYSDGGKQVQIGGQFDNRFVFNLRVDKFFFDRKLNAFIYGNDLTAGVFTEGVNQLSSVYPRQIGSMFGFGLAYSIK